MRVGVVIPQGLIGEYRGWQPAAAWARSMDIARQADRLGFDSVWVLDHVHTIPVPTDDIAFESFTTLTAAAMATSRVRLGHLVLCAGFRNPALTAKMLSTLDVLSGGRAELGIGAGWKEDEWRAYGYGYPAVRDRLAILEDSLEIISRMVGPGQASYAGTWASVAGAHNGPKPLTLPRLPIMVGGNGPKVTWRLAARLADELNLDGLEPQAVVEAMPVIRSRCEEIGRDPATLRVSVHMFTSDSAVEGSERIDRLAAYREAGVSRIQTLITASTTSDSALESFAEDCRAAGASLD